MQETQVLFTNNGKEGLKQMAAPIGGTLESVLRVIVAGENRCGLKFSDHNKETYPLYGKLQGARKDIGNSDE